MVRILLILCPSPCSSEFCCLPERLRKLISYGWELSEKLSRALTEDKMNQNIAKPKPKLASKYLTNFWHNLAASKIRNHHSVPFLWSWILDQYIFCVYMYVLFKRVPCVSILVRLGRLKPGLISTYKIGQTHAAIPSVVFVFLVAKPSSCTCLSRTFWSPVRCCGKLYGLYLTSWWNELLYRRHGNSLASQEVFSCLFPWSLRIESMKKDGLLGSDLRVSVLDLSFVRSWPAQHLLPPQKQALLVSYLYPKELNGKLLS